MMRTFVVVPSLSSRGLLPFLALLLLLSGCGKSVSLRTETQVPIPVVERLPLTIGVHFDEQFRTYVYQEDTESRPEWRIDNSTSRLSLFQQVLPSMFREVKDVEGTQSSGIQGLDAIISPEVDEMQLALPDETHSEIYEAWIRYNIRLYKPSGELIASWPVTGYGKSEQAFMMSRDKGLNQAINLALRDIGAKLALGFPRVEPVRQWLTANYSSMQ